VVPICTEEDIEGIRLACKLGREALDAGHKACQVGVTTEEIDRVVHESIIDNDAYPSPLNYYNFPKSVCT
jgi:methionyl aminopeptidase